MRDSTARVISAGIGMASQSVHGPSARGPDVSLLVSLRRLGAPTDADDAPRADAHAAEPVSAAIDIR